MKTAIADVLAQDLELAYITDADPPGLGLYTTITVAGQPMNVVVDTSSIRLLYVWQDAYEKARGVGACKRMFYHCYSCGRHQCKPQDTSNVTLGDGTSALIFRWADDMRVGGRNFMLMKFGLIFASEPTFAERTPHGVLGLGNDAGQYYPTIMDQLGVRIPYSKNMFTLYLRHSFGGNVPARGDLLIGGADKSAYVPPLRYMEFRVDERRVGFAEVSK
ncbi:hypothetical protein FOL47_002475 [Perkinsus chesapeaki]|uniref:Peptidase A1 domain-containing protein n=1 Tax=Perkinsus chesapeaki TaxID=330153 RepID=A0A7J6MDN8_PERCH|nr:hypothetical protein FOL47_002475 [Perkinsus chesapeaki]